MNEDMKKKFRRFAEEAEVGAVRSILKWNYKKKGKKIPSDIELDHQSRKAASLANDVISKTGKTVWYNLKEVYGRRAENGDVKNNGTKKGGAEE